MPLDSIAGARLFEEAPEFPQWTRVRYLTLDVSAAHQTAGQILAERWGLARDTYGWGSRE